jgi:hypothetical protein
LNISYWWIGYWGIGVLGIGELVYWWIGYWGIGSKFTNNPEMKGYCTIIGFAPTYFSNFPITN